MPDYFFNRSYTGHFISCGDRIQTLDAGMDIFVRRMVGNEVVLDGGVLSGEIIVTDGLNKLKDGMAVVIANTPASAAASAASGSR